MLERRTWGHWQLQTSNPKSINYYEDGKKQSWYGCAIYYFGYKDRVENLICHYSRKGYMMPQDEIDLRIAIEELINDGTIEEEFKRHNKRIQ